MTVHTKPRRGCPGFLHDDAVREIRRLFDRNGPYKAYANTVGASDQMARLIGLRKSYRHVPEIGNQALP